jgi:hypothetical protein
MDNSNTQPTSVYRLHLRPDQRAKVRVLAALRGVTMAAVLSALLDSALALEEHQTPKLNANQRGGQS